eukprot:TRINITY_DN51941_c0_g1_i1.p3 TRINITY_DN51941_c0_g1~~TRINITY_DN51941_c0_g1_i1.p3  ORF type:complete len:102 (-),score=24.75 TRINITY_DN51941_c0_g1_i1:56-361(-)
MLPRRVEVFALGAHAGPDKSRDKAYVAFAFRDSAQVEILEWLGEDVRQARKEQGAGLLTNVPFHTWLQVAVGAVFVGFLGMQLKNMGKSEEFNIKPPIKSD